MAIIVIIILSISASLLQLSFVHLYIFGTSDVCFQCVQLISYIITFINAFLAGTHSGRATLLYCLCVRAEIPVYLQWHNGAHRSAHRPCSVALAECHTGPLRSHLWLLLT